MGPECGSDVIEEVLFPASAQEGTPELNMLKAER